MFQEEDYTNCEEPWACVEASQNGCVWAGCLYQRKDGGFDLFYDHRSSDFKPLDIARITMLRHMSEADNGVVFIKRLEERTQKKLLEDARQHLLDWVAATLGD
jgi:hypothetical protein